MPNVMIQYGLNVCSTKKFGTVGDFPCKHQLQAAKRVRMRSQRAYMMPGKSNAWQSVSRFECACERISHLPCPLFVYPMGTVASISKQSARHNAFKLKPFVYQMSRLQQLFVLVHITPLHMYIATVFSPAQQPPMPSTPVSLCCGNQND